VVLGEVEGLVADKLEWVRCILGLLAVAVFSALNEHLLHNTSDNIVENLNCTTSISCGFVVQQDVQQVHKKSDGYSRSTTGHFRERDFWRQVTLSSETVN